MIVCCGVGRTWRGIVDVFSRMSFDNLPTETSRCSLHSLPFHTLKDMEVAAVVPFLDVTRVLVTSFSVSLMMC
jgi:hypothetical protein